ncbi:MAG: UDP-N-acetyl glucosamine 2-epimerase, partial [Cyanobacteria bacterium K_Offshore_0m_m2_072]|nr:UDP-N-acetyl glucosamine 2-epimerase [Cyanobacteria bacterium K_Offshore_0m_m2_072]
LTDHLAELCFAPTETAVTHLRREGIAEARIVRTGDVMADAARIFGAQPEANAAGLLTALGLDSAAMTWLIGAQPFILATIHRAENTNDPLRLRAILTALAQAPLPVLLPLHPRTRNRLSEQGL